MKIGNTVGSGCENLVSAETDCVIIWFDNFYIINTRCPPIVVPHTNHSKNSLSRRTEDRESLSPCFQVFFQSKPDASSVYTEYLSNLGTFSIPQLLN